MVAIRGSIYSPGQSATSPGTYPGAVTNWTLSRSASFIASPRWPGHSGYAQVIVPQGLVQVPGWTPYAVCSLTHFLHTSIESFSWVKPV
jgi:hypothetical protein